MMDENDKKTEAAINELKANVREQETREALFQQKVITIGELHTRRALLANRIGAIKSENIIHRGKSGDDGKNPTTEVEKTMREISKSITDFSPSTMEELETFKAKIVQRFESVKAKLEAIEAADKVPGA